MIRESKKKKKIQILAMTSCNDPCDFIESHPSLPLTNSNHSGLLSIPWAHPSHLNFTALSTCYSLCLKPYVVGFLHCWLFLVIQVSVQMLYTFRSSFVKSSLFMVHIIRKYFFSLCLLACPFYIPSINIPSSNKLCKYWDFLSCALWRP